LPGLSLQTEAFVLLRRASTESHHAFTVFSAEAGVLPALQRIARRPAGGALALDLFDEVELWLDSGNQGRTWFVREARLIARPAAIGRSYAALQAASALAAVIARNPVQEESRRSVAELLRSAFGALAAGHRPDLVYLKGLYRFARDEGYPVKQEWFPSLPEADQAAAARALNEPLAAQTGSAADVAGLRRGLEDYLRGRADLRIG
jgi:recombinational DNA repair protein (RecF pathway)